MEKDEAMLEFVKLLNKCCNLFAPFVASHKIEKEEQERKRSDLQIKIIDFLSLSFCCHTLLFWTYTLTRWVS